MDSMPSDQRASHLVPRRPHTPQMSTSFSRLASLPTNPLACRRASTLEAGTSVSTLGSEMNTSFTHYDSLEHRDIFDEGSPTSAAEGSFRDVSDVDSPQDVPAGFEELPIELISFIDRYCMVRSHSNIA